MEGGGVSIFHRDNTLNTLLLTIEINRGSMSHTIIFRLPTLNMYVGVPTFHSHNILHPGSLYHSRNIMNPGFNILYGGS
jgi:hypothetical protein